MGMAAQCVFQLLEKGDIAGLSRSQTLLILKKKVFNFTHSDRDNIVYRQTTKVVIRTRMEMMPLCFSSIRSQMILLSKYCTVSH